MKKKKRNKNSKGFTLIELLVVIAIIALLSSVVLASLSVARSKGRDAKRISDLHQIQNAIELYRSDNNGSVPGYPIYWYAQVNSQQYTDPTVALVPKYISKLPEDPSNPGLPPSGPTDGWWYYYGKGYSSEGVLNGQGLNPTDDDKKYAICTKLENPSIIYRGGWGDVLNYCVNG
jgi:prepilin-type N-terminal cleavage/methylation domain-containing protein